MLSLRRPGPRQIRAQLESVRGAETNLGDQRDALWHAIDSVRPWVQGPRTSEPLGGAAGFILDRYGCLLDGPAQAYVDRILGFRHYPAGWTHVEMAGEAGVGVDFLTLVSHLGFWSLNPCRIVELVKDHAPSPGGPHITLTLATLDGHAERGLERFTLRRVQAGLRYEVVAVSSPALWWSGLGKPYARRLQAKFAADSCARMRSRPATET